MSKPYLSSLGIVVVHYGDPEVTYSSLRSISISIKSFIKKENTKIIIIIIDNSHNLDNSIIEEIFKLKYISELIVVHHKPRQNLGFAGACELAARLLYKKRIKYILCLNNDLIIENDTIDKLVKYISSRQNIGMLQPLVLRAKLNKNKLIPTTRPDSLGLICDWSLSNCFNFSNWPLKNYIKKIHKVLDVPIVDGMIFIVSIDNWHKSGGMDPNFFLFNEDILLSLRMLAIGCSNQVDLEAKAYHVRGAVIEGKLVKREAIYTSFYTARNALLSTLYIYKGLDAVNAFIFNMLVRLLKTLSLVLYTRDILHIYYMLRVILYLLRNVSHIRNERVKGSSLKPRQLIKGKRMLTFGEMMRLLASQRKSLREAIAYGKD